MERIQIYTKPNCKSCLGSGKALLLRGGESVCSCVTEQLEIMCTEEDYGIPGADRYTPGQPSFIKEERKGFKPLKKK